MMPIICLQYNFLHQKVLYFEYNALRVINFFQFNVTVFQNLSKRMGFNSGYLTIKDVKAMWVACTFGQAWQPNEPSPWCSLFTQGLNILSKWPITFYLSIFLK